MKTHRLLSLTAAAAAFTLAVSATGQSTQPGQSDQPRFNRPQTQSTDTPRTDARANPADPAATPVTRPGTAADADLRSSANARADRRDNKLDRSDRNFFEKAAKSGQKEVAVSQAALAQLTAPGAREFAQMMIQDHNAANQELTALAQRKGFDMSEVNNSRDVERLTRKWSDKDDDIDENYLKEMIDDHEEAVELFEKASKSEDSEIAAFAAKTLPKLQHHLEMARTHHKSVENAR